MQKKSATHPKMKKVQVVFTNGETMDMMLSGERYDKDVLYLQSDILTHRAWRAKGEKVEFRDERIQKLTKKFPKF
jgi:ribosomal protein L31